MPYKSNNSTSRVCYAEAEEFSVSVTSHSMVSSFLCGCSVKTVNAVCVVQTDSKSIDFQDCHDNALGSSAKGKENLLIGSRVAQTKDPGWLAFPVCARSPLRCLRDRYLFLSFQTYATGYIRNVISTWIPNG